MSAPQAHPLQWPAGKPRTVAASIGKGKGCDVDAIAALRVWMNVPIDRFFLNGGAK